MNIFSKILALSVVLAVSYPSYAQSDINVSPLFEDENIYYTPIPRKDIEAEQIAALADKDSQKMYIIGMMFVDGVGVQADLLQALEWFGRSAELGNSDAMVELAKIYSLDKEITGQDPNSALAQKWVNEAEKRNNTKAIYLKALMYEEGFPFGTSYEKAFEYYNKAAALGVLNAYVKIYLAYQYGKGVDPDLKKAIKWLRRIQIEAPDGGAKQYAAQMLGEIYFELGLKEPDNNLKFRMLNLAWSNGNQYALEAIGDMMQAGIGVKRSYTSAIVAYDEAIKRYESVYAMERKGFLYLKGPAEIDRDYLKAYELFRRAADLGGVTAAYMLGYMYHYGLHVNRDPKESKRWFDRSTQLAQNRSQERSRQMAANDSSTRALQKIIMEANRREEDRLRLVAPPASDVLPEGSLPALPDIPKY